MRKTMGRSTNLVRDEEPPLPSGKLAFERTFPALNEHKSEVLDAVISALNETGLLTPGAEDVQTQLCLDEALVNALMHGSKYDPSKNVRVRLFIDGTAWRILIEDEGDGFKEEDLPDPEAAENLLEESGRGVFLIRNFMNEVSYWRGGRALLMGRGKVSSHVSPQPTQNSDAALRDPVRSVPLERRLRDLESILSLTRTMAAEPDLTRLLVLLAASCSNVLQVERTSIWVVDPQSGDLYTRVAEKTETMRVHQGKGIVGAVAESGETVLIPDAYNDPRFNPDFDRKSGFRTREILCLPMKDLENKRVVGVIQALNKLGGQSLDAYDVDLASIIAAQVGVVLEQAALREQIEEKKRMQAELELAHSIQQRLLPRESPEIKGMDIAGINRPATETSGDYFDYISLPDGRLAVVIADVTGHGLGAALVMTAARAFLRALCGNQSDSATIIAQGNNLLEHDLDEGNFLSLCLAAFDPERGTLQYTSAGHDPPLVYRPSEDSFAELESTGPLLGIVEGMEFGTSEPISLLPDDVMVLMTDGLFECMNVHDETFGKDRLKDVVRANAAKSAREILAALIDSTSQWTAGLPPRDDITVVVVKICQSFGN